MIQSHAFANIGRKYKTKRVASANLIACQVGAPGAVWGFAEIDEADLADETSALKMTFPDTVYSFSGLGTKVPIVAPDRYQVTARRPLKGAAGIEHWSPTRLITEMILDDGKFEIPVVRINTHFPRHNKNNGADREWDKLFKKLAQRHEYWLDRNYVIVGSADTNDHRHPNPVHRLPNARSVVDAEIDQIWIALPDDIRCRKLGEHKIDLNIDGHNAHVVRLDFQEK